MGSPLGSPANTLMCSKEKNLENKNELPSFCKRYIYLDDILTIMPNIKQDFYTLAIKLLLCVFGDDTLARL